MESKEIMNKNMLILMNEEIEDPRANKKWQEEWKIEERKIKEHWSKVWITPNLNWEKETLWRLTHRCLPTMAILAKWKMKDIKDNCPFCKQPENLNHAFIQCQRTRPLWDCVNLLTGKITQKIPPATTLVEVVFHMKLKTRDPIQKTLVKYITTTALNIIWNTRNAKLKDAKIPDLKEELKRRIKDRINVDAINKNEAHMNIWSHENILIKVTSDKITFLL